MMYTVGEMAKLLGVPASTLRYYDREGLLPFVERSPGGMQTLYAHCSSICVTTGQQMQAGQVMGYVGSTGRSTGNHRHLEIIGNGHRGSKS